jgi:hypothetical protein
VGVSSEGGEDGVVAWEALCDEEGLMDVSPPSGEILSLVG